MNTLSLNKDEVITSVKFIKSSFKIDKNDLEITVNINNKPILLDWFNPNIIQLSKNELIGLTFNQAQSLIIRKKIIMNNLKKLIGVK